MDAYVTLLAQIDTICKKFPPYVPLTGYNLFRVLEIHEKEVVMCRFLADLLNPEGRHGCGTLFLKSFLQNVLQEPRVSGTSLTRTDVIKEYVIDNDRRIDIIIQNAGFSIPMEVKLYAAEQEGQCYDYYEYARNAPLVYLTRFGDPPSVYSRKKRGGTAILPLEYIRCISWADDITGWLAGLLPQLHEPAAAVVTQYIDAIHAVADRRERDMMESCLEALSESPESFGAGLEIEKSMTAAKLRLMRLVFDGFKEEMEKIAPRYGLALETEADYYSYNHPMHEKFYNSYSTYPGLNYVIKAAKFQKSSLQMWFRIEVDHNLFAGISLFDTAAAPGSANTKGYQVDDITPELAEEAARYLNRDLIRPEAWWLTYCYPNGRYQEGYYEDVPDFKHMNPCAVSLVDPQTRKLFIQNAIKVFEEHLLQHLLTV